MTQRNDNVTRSIVCVGDSNTKGRYCFNWVRYLSKKFRNKKYDVINEGVNGDLAFNVLERIEKIVLKKPKYIVILVGSNDINATLSDKNKKSYIKQKKLPIEPSKDWYLSNLEKILLKIKLSKDTKIALSSIPIMGENIYDETNKIVNDYNISLENLSQKFKVDYLPFYESLVYRLEVGSKNGIGRPYQIGSSIKIKAVLRRYLLFQSWNKISNIHDLEFLTDTIHLNKRSAKVFVSLVESFILKYDKH